MPPGLELATLAVMGRTTLHAPPPVHREPYLEPVARSDVDGRWNIGLAPPAGEPAGPAGPAAGQVCYFCASLPAPVRAGHTFVEYISSTLQSDRVK